MSRAHITFFILSALFAFTQADAQSALASGEWYKFAIFKEGVYKLTRSDLQGVGINTAALDPASIKIYGNKGGMLPQKNSDSRPIDLQENAIAVVGGEDGKLDEQDFILFYAYDAHEYSYNTENDIFTYTKNKYDTINYYYLNISEGTGKRIISQTNLGSNFHVIDSYTDFYFSEMEETNLLHSGREWWGRLSSQGEKVWHLPFKDLDINGSTKAYIEVMSQANRSPKYEAFINGLVIGSITTDTIRDYTINSAYQYTIRGREANAIFEIPNSTLNSSDLKFNLKFISSGGSLARGYYNKLLVQTNRKLNYDNKQLIFHSPESAGHGLVTFRIENAASGLWVWDLQDDYEPKQQAFTLNDSEITFGTIGGTLKKFVVFNTTGLTAPDFVERVENQDIKSFSTPNLLIIAHPDFINETERLAQFRQTNDNYDVKLVSTEMIYNEFSSGRQDVTAIRDYIRYLYNKDNTQLRFVLLVGKGSYDYLGYENNNTNFVPIYQSRNSLHPVISYSSDDYYGFLEEEEGHWEENEAGDHTLDISIGRLPVVSNVELRGIIDKLINYSTSKESLGSWRSNMLFVADDEDNNLYQQQSERLTILADTSLQYFQNKKVFLGSYKQENTATSEKSPDAQKSLREALERGAFLVNYIGHGGIRQWADEEMLTNEIVDNLKNSSRLPLFVTATCEFGRHDDPLYRSGGEKLILNPSGGGIGLVTTSRPVYSSSNFDINRSFFNALNDNKSTAILGNIVKDTKNNALKGTDNRNFILLGDPSMRLVIPENAIVLDNIDQDTLKAQQEVTIHGRIFQKGGGFQEDFNGVVEITIYDKSLIVSTREDVKNTPYYFKEQKSVIFRGKASVVDGRFSSAFIVPRDIQYKIGDGRMYFYAFEHDGLRDATLGKKVKIGGTSPQTRPDNEGPEIFAYLEDSTFRNGDMIGESALLIAHLSDPSGINLTGRSFDGEITAAMDNDFFVLNDYYTSNIDDFTSGTLIYPLDGLSPGKHTLTISASDVYNNINSIQIQFVVEENKGLVIDELANFPNPVTSNTTFIFTHNRAGEPLEGTLTIYNNRGENILNFNFETPAGQVRHKIFTWDSKNINQSKIGEGIYYYRVSVRSKQDGAKAEKIQKLIIIN